MEKLIEKISISELQQKLLAAGIDVSQYGKGQAKTLADLQQEIEKGETLLATDKEGKLYREVRVCGVDIFYISPEGKKYRLKEEKQVFKDGRERRRDLGQAVSEKMKPGENPEEAALRGIKEELGIADNIKLEDFSDDKQILVSPSYPGLKSEYNRYVFKTILNENQFKPEGYTEEEGGKTTYFVWEEVK